MNSLEGLAGRTLEQVAFDDLVRKGYSLIRLANIEPGNGRGPAMEAQTGNATLPDALIVKPGKLVGLMDVKAKSKSGNPWHNRGDRLEQMIDEGAWQSYLKCSRELKLPVYICLLELQTFTIRLADSDTLNSRAGDPKPNTLRGKKVLLFRESAFDLVGTWAITNDDLRTTALDWHEDVLEKHLGQLRLFSTIGDDGLEMFP